MNYDTNETPEQTQELIDALKAELGMGVVDIPVSKPVEPVNKG